MALVKKLTYNSMGYVRVNVYYANSGALWHIISCQNSGLRLQFWWCGKIGQRLSVMVIGIH